MAIQTINIGTVPNDGTGDPIRTAFTKTNANFTELYTGLPASTIVGISDTQTLSNKTLASPVFTGTPVGLTKTTVGLANVDNTTDLNKPISTLTQSALDGKLALAANAASATKLLTARTINGVSFDGTANITITANVTSTGITDSTAPGRALLTSATSREQAALLTNIVTNVNTAITLAETDSGTIIDCTAGTTVTITVPSTLSSTFTVVLIQSGAGQLVFSEGSGTTLNSYLAMKKSSGQYAVVALVRRASGVYNLSGNISA